MTTRPTSRLLAAAALMVCAWANTARAEDWATPGLDGSHSRLSTERSGPAFGNARWSTSFRTGGLVLASPVVADGVLVTVDLDGVVSGLRADDGTPIWQATTGATVHGTPAVARGRVFVPTYGNQVVALRLADGAVLWVSEVGGSVLSSPAPVDGDVIVSVGFPQRHVARLSGETGGVVWQTGDTMQQFGNSSPAVGGGLVVVGSNGGRYYAFDADTGAARWEYGADGLVHLAAPIIVNGRVFMAGGGDSHHVHAVDAETGAAIAGWPVDLPTPAPDVAGSLIGRHRAISSFATVAGILVVQTRLDDALDTNADGVVDTRVSRETMVAIDSMTGDRMWQVPRGRTAVADANDVPKFLVCPTPAAYRTDSGLPLIVSASTLDPTIVTLDPMTGTEQARAAVAGSTLASPVLANGRLYTVTIDGTIEGLGSAVNHAPGAAIPARTTRALDVADLTLHWLAAIDPDAELPSYELRIDSDGEVLESWQQRIFVGSGATSAPIPDSLQPGVTYSFAVRARDPHGALSAWSALQTFTVFRNPPVTVDGTPVKTLAGALATALPGSVITLGAGMYTVTETLHVRGGVSIQGAGAGRTTLDASGLTVGISFDGTDAGHRTGLDGVTLTGAETCASVASGATGVVLSHVVVRDCRTTGLAVAATGGADVVNATLVGNGTGVSAAGSTRIKNSLLTSNGVALSSAASGVLTSAYNDLFGNQADYAGLQAGTGDLALAVTFADLANHSLRLVVAQPSTDRGDPADAVGDEPAPNGGRVNLGAFGGTADAEASAISSAVGGTGPGLKPAPVPGSPGFHFSAGTASADEGGCAVGGRSERGGAWSLFALAALAVWPRRSRRASRGD